MKSARIIVVFLGTVVVTVGLVGCITALPSAAPSTTTPPFSSPAMSPSSTSNAIPTISIPSPSNISLPTEPTPPPTPIYNPAAAPFAPTSAQLELMRYVLELINKDRTSETNGLPPVELGFNAAAQKHAQDMIDNHVLAAHWGTDGLKPYMRYTLEGGLNFDLENSCYVESSDKIDVKAELQRFENTMMFDDAASNWSHLNTIINKWNKKVNIGIAYSENAVALVQDFEGDYLEYFQPPTLTGNILSLSGRFKIGNVYLNNVTITFDDLPQPISPVELSNNDDYHHYSLGQQVGLVLPPPPPGQVYADLSENGVVAATWNIDQAGHFSIQADIKPILGRGRGVYTVVLVTILGFDHLNMTNYSIFVE